MRIEPIKTKGGKPAQVGFLIEFHIRVWYNKNIMKISKIITKIFLDMDGVISDFQPHADKVTAMYYGEEFKYYMRDFLKHGAPQEAQDKFWDAMRRYEEEKGRLFWEELEVIPDAYELIEFIDDLGIDHEILTATGPPEQSAKAQKERWINKHFGHRKVKTVRRGPDKANFAHAHALLIDDTEYVCKPFEEAGGVAVLHRTSKDTIAEICKILDS